jgi:hypothetical protein
VTLSGHEQAQRSPRTASRANCDSYCGDRRSGGLRRPRLAGRPGRVSHQDRSGGVCGRVGGVPGDPVGESPRQLSFGGHVVSTVLGPTWNTIGQRAYERMRVAASRYDHRHYLSTRATTVVGPVVRQIRFSVPSPCAPERPRSESVDTGLEYPLGDVGLRVCPRRAHRTGKVKALCKQPRGILPYMSTTLPP